MFEERCRSKPRRDNATRQLWPYDANDTYVRLMNSMTCERASRRRKSLVKLIVNLGARISKMNVLARLADIASYIACKSYVSHHSNRTRGFLAGCHLARDFEHVYILNIYPRVLIRDVHDSFRIRVSNTPRLGFLTKRWFDYRRWRLN